MSGDSSGGMSGDSSGGGGAGGAGSGGGGIRGVSGPVPGAGGAGGGGSGGDGMAGTECNPDGVGGTGGWGGPDESCDGSVGSVPGESDADRKARLEKTLEESVGGFDGVLADEQREISTVGRNTEGFGGGESGGAGSGRVGLGTQGGGGSSGGGGAGGLAGPPDEKQASVDGMSEEEIRARTPEDIPDLVSEDIVAKQLREAALAEDDPVLRERLWEEYRMYNDL